MKKKRILGIKEFPESWKQLDILQLLGKVHDLYNKKWDLCRKTAYEWAIKKDNEHYRFDFLCIIRVARKYERNGRSIKECLIEALITYFFTYRTILKKVDNDFKIQVLSVGHGFQRQILKMAKKSPMMRKSIKTDKNYIKNKFVKLIIKPKCRK